MKNGNIDLAGLKRSFSGLLRKLVSYKGFVFFLAVALLYGFIVWRINVYSAVPASASETAAQTTAQPHIDQTTAEKLQSLQDNSVSVQALFQQARDNPFQE